MTIAQLIIVATLVEAIGESIWWLVPKEGEIGWNRERIMALVIGLALAGLTGINALSLAGLEPPDYLPPVVWLVAGILCSGILVMRGATWVHDLFSLITSLSTKAAKQALPSEPDMTAEVTLVDATSSPPTALPTK
jgi:hypothetical protein